MSIKSYYNGSYKYERRNNTPPLNGNYSYDAPIFIGAFRRKKTKTLIIGLGQQFVSNTSYSTEEVDLRTGDKIDDRIIMSTDEPDSGNIRYWRCYV